MAVNLSNLLSSLTTGQLATIDYLAGVDQNGTALTTVSTSWRQYVANTTTPPSNSNVFTFGAGAVVTIGFYGTGAEAFSDADKAYAWQALSLWSSLMGISFKYVSDTTKAEVNFVHASDTYGTAKKAADTGTYFLATTGVATATPGIERTTTGFINYDNGGSFGDITSYTVTDGYGIDTLVHEAGHLIGLGHAGPYNGTIDARTQQRSETDDTTWSIMSYVTPTNNTAPDPTDPTGKRTIAVTQAYLPVAPGVNTPGDADYGADWKTGNKKPYTPMGLDIFAGQRLNGGPALSTFAGGQTFGFNSNITYTNWDGTRQNLAMFDFMQDTVPVLTLYDYGSNNTLDLSKYTSDSVVNLNDGTFSSIAGLTDNVFIEYGTQIDHLIEGSGNDIIIANERSDVIDGGGGINTVRFSGARSAYVLSYSGSTAILTNSSSGAAYRLTNIQQVQFGSAPAIALADLPRVQWVGASGGHFGIGANWSDGQVPGSSSQLQIYSGANILVTLQESNEVDSLVMAAGATIDITSGHFIIDNVAAGSTNAGSIQVESGTTLYLAGGLTNTGTLALYGGTLQTYSHVVSLSGGGTITLQNGHIGGQDASGSPLAYDTFTNVDNTISGSGSIGRSGFLFPLKFHNAENANVVATAGTLQVSGAITNDGIMGASDNGLLDLSGTIDQTAGGRIVSLGINASVVLDGGTITGGTVAAFTGTVEVASDETLTGLTLLGTVKVDAGKKLALVGNIDATSATIDASAGFIDLSHATVTGGAFKLSPNQSLDGLVVNSADLSGLTIYHDQTVTVRTAVTNSTLLNIVGSAGYGPATLAVSGNVTLSGGGGLKLADSTGNNYDVAYITGSGPTDVLENVDNTIRGYGELGLGKLVFNNDANGTVNATVATLRLWTVSASNSGLLESTGGLLLIETALNNGGGTILAPNTGRIQLGGEGRATTITAGTLRTTGTGAINVDSAGAIFDGSNYAVNQQATLDVNPSATLTIKGTVANTGVIRLNGQAGYSRTLIAVSGSAVLQGGGQVLLNDISGNRYDVAGIAGSSSSDTLTNLDNYLYGFGSIGLGTLTFVNQGQVTASGGTLTVDTGASTIANRGTLEGYGGGLVINSAVANAGSIIGTTAGSVRIRGLVTGAGALYFTVDSRLILDGGSLRGTGTLSIDTNATLEISTTGTIDATSQTVALSGATVIDAAATLTLKGTIGNNGRIAINGQAGYSQSAILVSGPVTLSGGGSVGLIDTSGNKYSVSAITGSSIADVLTNRDNVIAGYGSIGQGTMTLVNQAAGVINATTAALTLDTGAAVIANAGLLEAVGGTLVVNSAITGSGRIIAGAAGTVVLRKAYTGSGSAQATSNSTLVLDGGVLINTGGVISAPSGTKIGRAHV